MIFGEKLETPGSTKAEYGGQFSFCCLFVVNIFLLFFVIGDGRDTGTIDMY